MADGYNNEDELLVMNYTDILDEDDASFKSEISGVSEESYKLQVLDVLLEDDGGSAEGNSGNRMEIQEETKKGHIDGITTISIAKRS